MFVKIALIAGTVAASSNLGPKVDPIELAQITNEAAEDAGLELLDLYDEANLMIADGTSANPEVDQIM